MKKKVNYTRGFKIQACELVLKDGVKVKTVADKMCISNVYNKEAQTFIIDNLDTIIALKYNK